MDLGSKIALALFAAFLIWGLFRVIRSNPESLSFANLNKSFGTMGLLALGLIIFIAVIVYLLRGF